MCLGNVEASERPDGDISIEPYAETIMFQDELRSIIRKESPWLTTDPFDRDPYFMFRRISERRFKLTSIDIAPETPWDIPNPMFFDPLRSFNLFKQILCNRFKLASTDTIVDKSFRDLSSGRDSNLDLSTVVI